MRKIIFILIWIMIPLSFLQAQKPGINYNYAKDKNGNELLREITFVDSVYKSIAKRLDVYDFNPFMKAGFPSEFDQAQQFPKLILKGKAVKDLMPAAFAANYEKGSVSMKDSLSFGLVDLYVGTQNPSYTVLSYHMKLRTASKLQGMIGSFSYFDWKGGQLLSFQPYDVNVTDVQISPKGRFIAHSFGMNWPGGAAMKHGVRVIDYAGKRYTDVYADTAGIKMLTDNYLVVYSYGKAGDTPGFKIQYFDLRKAFMYTQVYSEEYASKVTADYGERANFKIDGRVITVENDFAGEELIWKSFEKEWSINGQ